MISQEKIKNTVQLTLITFDQFKTNYSKRNFLYEFGNFMTAITKNSKILENIRKNPEIQIIVANQKIPVRAQIITKYDKVLEYFKKEMEKLREFYGNKYDRSEAHLRVSATNHVLLILKPSQQL